MNFIAVLVTILVGYFATQFCPVQGYIFTFVIATMEYFILKKLDSINSKSE